MYVVKTGPPEAEIVSLQAMLTFARIQRQIGDDVNDDNNIKALIVAAREMAETYTGRSLAKKPYMQVHDSFPYYIDAVQSRDAYPPSYYSAPRYSTSLWNYSQSIKLLYPPLASMDVTITYVGTDGLDHNLVSGQDFQVDVANEPARLFPLPGGMWPACQYCANAVRIFHTSGYEVRSTEEPAGEIDSPSVNEPEEMVTAIFPSSNQVSRYVIDRTVPEVLVLAVKQLVVHWYQNRDPVVVTAGAGGIHQPLPYHVEALLESCRTIDFAPTRG